MKTLRPKTEVKILAVFLLGGCLALLMTMNATAAPARPVEVTLTQPDGSQFAAVPWGDEWMNGMETTDGYTILLSPQTDFWVYARLTSENRLAPRLGAEDEWVVGRDDPSSLPKHIRPMQPGDSRSGLQSEVEPQQTSRVGNRKVLVLLVDFLDTPGRTTPEHWHNKIFGQTNSLRHYFSEASFGNLTLTPAAESFANNADGVVGWLTLPYNHPNSGGNVSVSSRRIASDAIQAADPYVFFAAFDRNWDGMISYDELHIMIIVAGNETAYGGSAGTCAPSIWAHAWGFVWDAPIVDGVRVGFSIGDGGYTLVGEWHCEISDQPGHPASIGVLAHELGHELGWPDLYDISGRSAGLGYWDVMANGLWNNSGGSSPDGSSPALPNPWSRWHQGWFEPVHITTSQLDVSVPAIQDSSTVYQLLDNPNGVDWEFNWRSGWGEYFLIENRQQAGYDIGLPGSGLLIWHIDESRPFDNSANANPHRRLVDLTQADGFRHLNLGTGGNRGDRGDPYPGSSQNRTFNAASNPSSHLYDGSLSGVSITEISDNGPVITANFFVNSFNDVSVTDWAWSAIESLAASGVTTGCQPGFFCPEKATTRAQMAPFLLRALRGGGYLPTAAVGLFGDVPWNYWAVDWIETLYAAEITVGCSVDPLRYCPEDPVTRAEMAVFLMRAKRGAAYTPPPAQGLFADVPVEHWAAPWIEQLYREGITMGTSNNPLTFSPENTLTRAEMAAFLERTFNLPAP